MLHGTRFSFVPIFLWTLILSLPSDGQALPVRGLAVSDARPAVPFTEYGEGTRSIPSFCGSPDTLWQKPYEALRMLPRKSAGRSGPIAVTMHDIGAVGSQRIIELQYRASFDEQSRLVDTTHAVFTRDVGGSFCLLLAFARVTGEDWITNNWKPASKIVRVEGQPLLQFILALGGSGHLLQEHYFVFENGGAIPLEFSRSQGSRFTELTPQGTRARKGGAFCLADLQWRSSLWRDGDPECCPSAGALFVKYRINGHILEAIGHQIYASYTEMEEARGARNCDH